MDVGYENRAALQITEINKRATICFPRSERIFLKGRMRNEMKKITEKIDKPNGSKMLTAF